MKHCIAKVSNGLELYAESWLEVTLFGKSFRFWYKCIKIVDLRPRYKTLKLRQSVLTSTIPAEDKCKKTRSRQKRPLTPYGKWIKIQLAQKDMTLTELAEQSGVVRQRIREVMCGVYPGNSYKQKIEKVLGTYIVQDLENVG